MSGSAHPRALGEIVSIEGSLFHHTIFPEKFSATHAILSFSPHPPTKLGRAIAAFTSAHSFEPSTSTFFSTPGLIAFIGDGSVGGDVGGFKAKFLKWGFGLVGRPHCQRDHFVSLEPIRF